MMYLQLSANVMIASLFQQHCNIRFYADFRLTVSPRNADKWHGIFFFFKAVLTTEKIFMSLVQFYSNVTKKWVSMLLLLSPPI